MENKLSIGILSWNKPEILDYTLSTYGDLLQLSDNVVILFQECDHKDIYVAEKYNLEYIEKATNIGIGEGFLTLAKSLRYDNILLLENDWSIYDIFNSKNSVIDEINSSIDLLQSNKADVVRLRSRVVPGYPLYTLQYEGRELDLSTHLLDCIHWQSDPEKLFPDKITYSDGYYHTTSRYGNFTNNPCMYRKQFYIDTVGPFVGKGNELEGKITQWWSEQNFKVAQGYGIFTHGR